MRKISLPFSMAFALSYLASITATAQSLGGFAETANVVIQEQIKAAATEADLLNIIDAIPEYQSVKPWDQTLVAILSNRQVYPMGSYFTRSPFSKNGRAGYYVVPEGFRHILSYLVDRGMPLSSKPGESVLDTLLKSGYFESAQKLVRNGHPVFFSSVILAYTVHPVVGPDGRREYAPLTLRESISNSEIKGETLSAGGFDIKLLWKVYLSGQSDLLLELLEAFHIGADSIKGKYFAIDSVPPAHLSVAQVEAMKPKLEFELYDYSFLKQLIYKNASLTAVNPNGDNLLAALIKSVKFAPVGADLRAKQVEALASFYQFLKGKGLSLLSRDGMGMPLYQLVIERGIGEAFVQDLQTIQKSGGLSALGDPKGKDKVVQSSFIKKFLQAVRPAAAAQASACLKLLSAK